MKVIAGITLAFVLGTMFVSLFHMASAMEMRGGMSNCPFMAHKEVICPMDLADHIGMWKNVFMATIPPLELLLVVVAAIVFVATAAPHLLVPRGIPILLFFKRLRERIYTYTYRPMQDLFSNGILNPKLFGEYFFVLIH